MGPRSVERGKGIMPTGWNSSGFASMGPRSVERGKESVPKGALWRIMLQWGRVLLNAESPDGSVRRGGQRASMGPRSVERGKRLQQGGICGR